MSFVMASDVRKKIKFLDADGTETYEDEDPYLFLRYAAMGTVAPAKKRQLDGAKPSSGVGSRESHLPEEKGILEDVEEEDIEFRPDPQAAAESLLAAQQELTGLVELINSVESMQSLAVQYVHSEVSTVHRLRFLSIAKEKRRSQYQAAAGRLRDAASQLRRKFERDNAYFQDLSRLQGFWRIAVAPAAFHATLAFPVSYASQGAKQGDAPPPLPFEHIRLLQSPSGAVCASIAPEDDVPTVEGHARGSAHPSNAAVVAIGAANVHDLLLNRFCLLLRTAVGDRCRWELQVVSHGLFTRTLVHRCVLEDSNGEERPGSPGRLLFPILQRLMVSKLIPGPETSSQLQLVPAVLCVLKEVHLSKQITHALDSQVMKLPGFVMLTNSGCSNVALVVLIKGRDTSQAVVAFQAPERKNEAISVSLQPPASVAPSTMLNEVRLDAASLVELQDLLAHFWGVPGDHEEAQFR